ncbi:polyhomeotic-like protein 1 [Nematolebias whitei]|uniref:polyhomeotic-like protein 1 n=1 Tax=Nematolebias whitei TaxID=451745 RepID=UPI0018976D6C|nr:polyhomeotic-like protein 1 [Nematolebias whitei]
MDTSEDQNASGTNGNPQTSGNSRAPQIAHMSLCERQAVQALQALQRQPNAAQYFQQLMLQQQINNVQLNTLAAVQQATLAASRQSNTSSHSMSQAPTTVNLSTTSTGGTMSSPRPHGPVTSAATTALNQSVLLGGNSTGQGQMYLRVNRSLRAPLASQLIFMPGGTTATVAAVAQTQPQQQQHESAATTATVQSDCDQVQNLALHCASNPKAAAVKSEISDWKDAASFPLSPQQQSFPQTAQQQQVQPQQQQMAKTSFNQQSVSNSMAVKTGNQSSITVTPAASVAPSPSSSSPALPLSQLLLSSSAAPVILVPSSNVTTSTQCYPIGSVAPKTNINTQTLVVHPVQQASTTMDKGPVPIQPKTAQGHRLPLHLSPRNLPPILPAPPSNSQVTAGGHNPPHIPVQLVGARQGVAGNAQAVALTQTRSSTAQDSPSGGTVTSVSNNTAVTKPVVGSLKRKSECDAANDMAEADSAPMKDCAPPLSPAPTKDSTPSVESIFSSPPTLSLPPPLSRVGHGDKDRLPVPQAVVKPQVLTHLIEGFVIQEGAEPFPVAGFLKDRDFALVGRTENGPPLLKCEYCGCLAPASQFRGSKRFCSNTCAKRYNVSCSQHYKTSRGRSGGGLPPRPAAAVSSARPKGSSGKSSSNTAHNKISNKRLSVKCNSESSRSEDMSSDGEEEDSPSLSPSSSSRSCSRAEHSAPQSDSSAPLDGANFLSATPAQWSVEEVCKFVSSLQGCEELAAQFLSQEIDGQALLLLREEHLISTMNIKLGPALKICASINSLRE